MLGLEAFVQIVPAVLLYLIKSGSATSNTSAHQMEETPYFPDRISKDLCLDINRNCNFKREYCCREEAHLRPRCCSFRQRSDRNYPFQDNQQRFPNGNGRFSHYGYPTMWNMWFAMILVLATCFTGCNYWRRQRQLGFRDNFFFLPANPQPFPAPPPIPPTTRHPHPTRPSILLPPPPLSSLPPSYHEATRAKMAAEGYLPGYREAVGLEDRSPPSYNSITTSQEEPLPRPPNNDGSRKGYQSV